MNAECTTEASRVKAVMERAGGRQALWVGEEGVCVRERERERGREGRREVMRGQF